MMSLIKTLVAMLFVVTASSKETAKSKHCDVPDKALLEEKLDKLFSELPEEYTVKNSGGTSLIPGVLFLGNTTIRGLNYLISDRPYKTFCRGEDKVTLFTLRTIYPLRVVIPWNLCSAQNGTVRSYAGTVRYKGELVTKNSGKAPLSEIKYLSTVQLEGFQVGLTGGGGTLDTVVTVMGYMFSLPVRLYWTEEMTRHVRAALNDALKAAE